VTKAFVACSRCSFFLAGYRTLHDDFEQVVENSQSNWLDLTWNSAIRDLIYKSYGSQFQEDVFHFEGMCPDCRRTFVFRGPATSRKSDAFRIQIHPA